MLPTASSCSTSHSHRSPPRTLREHVSFPHMNVIKYPALLTVAPATEPSRQRHGGRLARTTRL